MTNAPDASSHHRMLHELVNAVVRERAPEQLEGLDSRVSHLVRLLEEEAADRKPEHHESGLPVLPFDPVSAGGGFSLATIVWLAYEMVRVRAGERLDRLDRGGSPFVFLNACSAGRSALSLTGLGGFADKLVQQGAGAVIGPLWEVGDRAASAMAVSFYRRFLNGGTLSQSLRDARLEVRQSAGGDPTWLAYTAFGHPDARIDPPAQDPSASSP